MTTVLERRKQATSDKIVMQWRGSKDAISWTPWHSLIAINQRVDHYFYYQARVLVYGHWRTSKIERDEF